jgi:hypothetical protein
MDFLYLARQERKGVINVYDSANEKLKNSVSKKLAEHIINSLIFNNIPVEDIDDILEAGKCFNHKTKLSRARREFRRRIIDNEEYICKFCSKTHGKLTVHHIEPVEYCPELK